LVALVDVFFPSCFLRIKLWFTGWDAFIHLYFASPSPRPPKAKAHIRKEKGGKEPQRRDLLQPNLWELSSIRMFKQLNSPSYTVFHQDWAQVQSCHLGFLCRSASSLGLRTVNFVLQTLGYSMLVFVYHKFQLLMTPPSLSANHLILHLILLVWIKSQYLLIQACNKVARSFSSFQEGHCAAPPETKYTLITG
jgi:hypothetical protein